MTKSTRPLHRMFSALLVIALVLAAVPITLIFGPELESRFFPVLKDLPDPPARRDADGFTFKEQFVDKLRPCVFLTQSFLIGSNGEYRRLEFDRPGMKGGPPRPTGVQSFGTYRFDTRSAQAGEQIVGMYLYSCHAFWLTSGFYDPFPVPPLP